MKWNSTINCKLKLNPCKNCPNRILNCHATCQKYIEWQKEYQEENNKLLKDKKTRELYYCCGKFANYGKNI